MIVGGAILPLGLFCFAATSSPDVSAWPQILSGGLIGAGIQIVTLQSLAYVLDIYTVNANSAIAGTVIVRSILGGFLPLLAVPMYGQLGVSESTYLVSAVLLITCRLGMHPLSLG
jgi:hypothetical protein